MEYPDSVTSSLFVSGKVQGVGYRRFSQKFGERLGLTGWVRNLPDGRVELCITGAPENFDQFLNLLKKGPPRSKVDHVAVLTISGQTFTDFQVRPTPA